MKALPTRVGETTVLVGRARELARIDATLNVVADARGQAILIDGQSGIGKTRLATDGLRLAASRGFDVMVGRSNSLTSDLAYAPLVQAIGGRIRRFGPSELDDLTGGLSALGDLFEELNLPRPTAQMASSIEKARLFEAVLRLIDRLTRRAPVALFLDDIQWLDHASIEMLGYLRRELPGLPLALIATWNRTELTDDFLLTLVTNLRRSGLLEEIELGRLSGDEVAAMLESLLGGPVSGTLKSRVVATADGVPLFVDALIRGLRAEGRLENSSGLWAIRGDANLTIPAVVADVAMAQLRGLTDEERNLVEIVSAGGEVTPDVLLRTASLPDGASTLAGLTNRRILIEELTPSPRVQLWHPLVRDLLYRSLSETKHATLHARLASAWYELAPSDVTAIALHVEKGLARLDPAWALGVLTRAADELLARHATSEAIGRYQAAVAVARAEGSAELPALLTRLGEARFAAARLDDALTAWREALELVDARTTAQFAYRVQRNIAFALGEVAFDESDRQIEVALASRPEAEPTEDSLELLYLAVSNAHRRGDLAALHRAARRVIDAAARVPGRRARGIAEAAHLAVFLEKSDYENVRVLLGRGDMLRSGDAFLEMRHHILSAHVAAVFAELSALAEANERARALLRKLNVPSWEIRVYVGAFCEALYSGDWQRAREVIQEADLLSGEIHHPLAALLIAMLASVLYSYQADFEPAGERLRHVADAVGEPVSQVTVSALFHSASSILALEKGDSRDALLHLDAMGEAHIGATLPPWDLVTRGMAHAALGQTGQALRWADRLDGLGGQRSYPVAMAARIRGHAYHADGCDVRARTELERAIAMFSEAGMPFEQARAGIELMELSSVGHVDPDRLTGWLATMERLGAARYQARGERILESLGRRFDPTGVRFDLTPRQMELAALVAKGMSNAEIAEELFISVRTVHSHLDHIYTRLGIGSRTALAAYVFDHRSAAHS